MNKPLYKSVPTYRDYKEYLLSCEYTKGWNDAMDFIFSEHKKKRERERLKKQLKLIVKEQK